MLYKDSTLDFNDDIEFRSTKTTELLQSTLEKKKGLYWNTQKWRNVVRKDWDVRNFPFDKQSLTMYLESASRDTSKLIFTHNARMSPENLPASKNNQGGYTLNPVLARNIGILIDINLYYTDSLPKF